MRSAPTGGAAAKPGTDWDAVSLYAGFAILAALALIVLVAPSVIVLPPNVLVSTMSAPASK